MYTAWKARWYAHARTAASSLVRASPSLMYPCRRMFSASVASPGKREASRSPCGASSWAGVTAMELLLPLSLLGGDSSLHVLLQDAPVRARALHGAQVDPMRLGERPRLVRGVHLLLVGIDRKSTRLNSSHVKISYAV